MWERCVQTSQHLIQSGFPDSTLRKHKEIPYKRFQVSELFFFWCLGIFVLRRLWHDFAWYKQWGLPHISFFIVSWWISSKKNMRAFCNVVFILPKTLSCDQGIFVGPRIWGVKILITLNHGFKLLGSILANAIKSGLQPSHGLVEPCQNEKTHCSIVASVQHKFFVFRVNRGLAIPMVLFLHELDECQGSVSVWYCMDFCWDLVWCMMRLDVSVSKVCWWSTSLSVWCLRLMGEYELLPASQRRYWSRLAKPLKISRTGPWRILLFMFTLSPSNDKEHSIILILCSWQMLEVLIDVTDFKNPKWKVRKLFAKFCLVCRLLTSHYSFGPREAFASSTRAILTCGSPSERIS